MREHKALADFKLDAGGEAGTFRATIATLNVVDHDNDVTVPGAFKTGQAVRIARWGHNWGDLPIGKGVIGADDKRAYVDGKLFLDTTHGKDAYTTIKELGELAEWSYGYDVVDSELGQWEGKDVRFLKALDVFECSPVMLGAGIGTGTDSIKAAIKTALAVHHTETSDGAWDGPKAEAALPSEAAALRKAFAWVDPDGDPDAKSSYKFIHHNAGGAANVKACVTGIGVLNGGRGGANIPDDQRKGVWAHLAAHLRDADVEPPELKGELRLVDHVALALATDVAIAKRLSDLATMRSKEGRRLSAANRDRLSALLVAMREGADALDTFLSENAPSTDAPKTGVDPIDALRLPELARIARNLGVAV